jgi:hypothetical protein
VLSLTTTRAAVSVTYLPRQAGGLAAFADEYCPTRPLPFAAGGVRFGKNAVSRITRNTRKSCAVACQYCILNMPEYFRRQSIFITLKHSFSKIGIAVTD